MMLHIANHQRNANQYNEISLHNCQNVYHQKVYKQQMMKMEWELQYTTDVKGSWYSHHGKQYGGSSKT